MANAMLMDRPQDFERYGVRDGAVEPWEDGRRDNSDSGHFEWWYFDMILDDGAQAVFQFLTKTGMTIGKSVDTPMLNVTVTMPDGEKIEEHYECKASFLQDAEGNVVFESREGVRCEVLEEQRDAATGKDYPQAIAYTFEQDGKRLSYTLRAKDMIEHTHFFDASFLKKAVLKRVGMPSTMSYARYLGHGDMAFDDGAGEVKRSADLIYEFMYGGATFKGFMEA